MHIMVVIVISMVQSQYCEAKKNFLFKFDPTKTNLSDNELVYLPHTRTDFWWFSLQMDRVEVKLLF
jgi:hypothetical protein